MLDGAATGVGERDRHPAAVRGHRSALHESAPLQRLDHPGERALGQVALVGQVGGLHLPPDPQDPQCGEPSPRESELRQHVPLGLPAHRGGGPVDVGHRQHRVEVEAPAAEAFPDEALGVQQARPGCILRRGRRRPRTLVCDFVSYQTDVILQVVDGQTGAAARMGERPPAGAGDWLWYRVATG